MPKRIGYARVSTRAQNIGLQRSALKNAGCDVIFTDKASGGKRERPGLQKALKALGPGDQLVVWKLDRLGRSLIHLVELLGDLNARGVHFESLTEKIDTLSPYGEFIFHIIAAVAQMERRLIRERTLAGLEEARHDGKKLGRRCKLNDGQRRDIRRARARRSETVPQLARRLRVSEMTVYRVG